MRALLQPEAGAQTIAAREGIVHDDHVGPMTLQRDGELRLARDGAEQPVSRLQVEELLEARTQGGMVVDGTPVGPLALRYGVISPRRMA